ncbi:hypothetical protein EDD54_1656 [Oharaeibacter diazotrophicus]|uniref:Uncharacterized protein n=1 Tax=Oharaeibacter diazotrophicus TaxID=1920512 RepID=A0A4R6RNV5_9HYPH|nr:hypothetical protein EDD54_1656 [Oharaeibacter diazotrophicus]GLS77038.1 hypothetical protein GCM10007904_23750 [Oharaeibacter diazotrophicus]
MTGTDAVARPTPTLRAAPPHEGKGRRTAHAGATDLPSPLRGGSTAKGRRGGVRVNRRDARPSPPRAGNPDPVAPLPGHPTPALRADPPHEGEGRRTTRAGSTPLPSPSWGGSTAEGRRGGVRLDRRDARPSPPRAGNPIPVEPLPGHPTPALRADPPRKGEGRRTAGATSLPSPLRGGSTAEGRRGGVRLDRRDARPSPPHALNPIPVEPLPGHPTPALRADPPRKGEGRTAPRPLPLPLPLS